MGSSKPKAGLWFEGSYCEESGRGKPAVTMAWFVIISSLETIYKDEDDDFIFYSLRLFSHIAFPNEDQIS